MEAKLLCGYCKGEVNPLHVFKMKISLRFNPTIAEPLGKDEIVKDFAFCCGQHLEFAVENHKRIFPTLEIDKVVRMNENLYLVTAHLKEVFKVEEE